MHQYYAEPNAALAHVSKWPIGDNTRCRLLGTTEMLVLNALAANRYSVDALREGNFLVHTRSL
jgi:hypothetical protein